MFLRLTHEKTLEFVKKSVHPLVKDERFAHLPYLTVQYYVVNGKEVILIVKEFRTPLRENYLYEKLMEVQVDRKTLNRGVGAVENFLYNTPVHEYLKRYNLFGFVLCDKNVKDFLYRMNKVLGRLKEYGKLEVAYPSGSDDVIRYMAESLESEWSRLGKRASSKSSSEVLKKVLFKVKPFFRNDMESLENVLLHVLSMVKEPRKEALNKERIDELVMVERYDKLVMFGDDSDVWYIDDLLREKKVPAHKLFGFHPIDFPSFFNHGYYTWFDGITKEDFSRLADISELLYFKLTLSELDKRNVKEFLDFLFDAYHGGLRSGYWEREDEEPILRGFLNSLAETYPEFEEVGDIDKRFKMIYERIDNEYFWWYS